MRKEQISIHAPHEGERRIAGALNICSPLLFQSTLPTMGSDRTDTRPPRRGEGISIHAPHEGERPFPFLVLPFSIFDFNPRSPRGGATRFMFLREYCMKFQSTLPTRGSDAEPSPPWWRRQKFQSTLPTRGSDRPASQARFRLCHFNPRSPRGGATVLDLVYISFATTFQSTLPTRGSDDVAPVVHGRKIISIHAPHEGERPALCPPRRPRPRHFNPRSPRGGATLQQGKRGSGYTISIHAPHEGGATITELQWEGEK